MSEMRSERDPLVHQSGEQLELHPSWPDLTVRQREAINELWDEMCVPALEEVDQMRRRMEDMQLEVQDARSLARRTQELADQRAERERAKRQELLTEVARLNTRVLELEGMELPHAA
jgi:uncharacterized protein (DUF58 family)